MTCPRTETNLSRLDRESVQLVASAQSAALAGDYEGLQLIRSKYLDVERQVVNELLGRDEE